jgi:hypothetical protein
MMALGALLTCSALLALAVLAIVFRSPNPPRWTTSTWADELISVGLVSLFALGLATFVAGAVSASREGVQLVDVGLLAAVLLASVVIWRKFDLRARWRASAGEPARPAVPDAGTGRVAPTVVTATASELPPIGPGHRAA